MFALGISSILFEGAKKVLYSKTALVFVLGIILTLFIGSKVSGLTETIGGWFGQKTVPELKEEIRGQKKVIDDLVQENKDKDTAMDIQDDIHKETVDSIVDVNKKDKEIDKSVSNNQAKKKKKLNDLEKTPVPIEELVYVESEIILDSLHSVYHELCQKTRCEGSQT